MEMEPKDQKTPFVLYFVRKGSDMTNVLIDGNSKQHGLKAHVVQRGAIVLDSFDKKNPPWPTHLVMNKDLRPASVAQALGFYKNVDELEEFLEEHGIICAIRKWAERGNRVSKPPFEQPSMMELYMGLQQRKRSSSPSGYMDHDEAARRVRRRLQRAVTGTARRECRNNALADFFYKLSKAYQTCPLHETDEWRAYSFSVTSGRLKYLVRNTQFFWLTMAYSLTESLCPFVGL
jgi:hypothetical protein